MICVSRNFVSRNLQAGLLLTSCEAIAKKMKSLTF